MTKILYVFLCLFLFLPSEAESRPTTTKEFRELYFECLKNPSRFMSGLLDYRFAERRIQNNKKRLGELINSGEPTFYTESYLLAQKMYTDAIHKGVPKSQVTKNLNNLENSHQKLHRVIVEKYYNEISNLRLEIGSDTNTIRIIQSRTPKYVCTQSINTSIRKLEHSSRGNPRFFKKIIGFGVDKAPYE